MMFGLSDNTIEKIQHVIESFPEVDKAVIYGSRAKGNYQVGSDIDLTLFGEKCDRRVCAAIEAALDELLLPYTIDLSVFTQIHHPALEDHIERVGKTFYQRKSDQGGLTGA